MSTTVKRLEVTYQPINKDNTFTNGDMVSGKVTLEVVKDCEIDSLSIKFKGKSEVLWTERHGQTTVVYHSKEKYFSVTQFFIRDQKTIDNRLVTPGCHDYPFTFQIPLTNMPPSFKGRVGKIVYLLEAKLSRSMRINKKDSTKISFVPKTFACDLPAPQHDSKDKKLKFFNSGTVAMDVNIEKTGFHPGEIYKVDIFAHIQNNSSREIKPKYCVYRKHSFFASGKRNLDTKDLFKEVGDVIPSSTSTNVTRVITIPPDLEPSILNCNNIKTEYRLRVYLDVKYASDPKLKFPIVILPASLDVTMAALPAATAAPAFGFEPFGNPDGPVLGAMAPPPPAAALQPLEPPPPYMAYGMYPPLNDFPSKYQS
uniref:Arrestin domain-containing protein 3-like n=1 Tax=Gouania willdenowi TaxID=441366 RepID=A0A8C5I6F3_GOUWI